MSTVLWANYLVDGRVTSDAADKRALFRHADKIDAVCRRCGITPLSEICDSTDMQFNVSDMELPDGMESTDELMARDGVWIDARAAVDWLEKLVAEIRQRKTRFGLIGNAHDDVVAELEQSLEFARDAAARDARFNFSMVM